MIRGVAAAAAPEPEHENVSTRDPGGSCEDPSLTRVGAFSDGVFAFAITLLILSIRIPQPSDADANHGLASLLTGIGGATSRCRGTERTQRNSARFEIRTSQAGPAGLRFGP